MPIAAAIPAIAGIGGSLLGGIGGASNTRPPSLDPSQSGALDSLIKMLMPQVSETPKIDPVQQSGLFDQIARSGVGGANRITNQLVSRGLGRSGLLAQGLTQNSNQMAAEQTGVNVGLQQQAIQQRNQTIQQILSLLGVSNIPGQSKFGGFMSGFAGPFSKMLAGLGGSGSSSGPGNGDFGGEVTH